MLPRGTDMESPSFFKIKELFLISLFAILILLQYSSNILSASQSVSFFSFYSSRYSLTTLGKSQFSISFIIKNSRFTP